ncbi:unnamed protein product, partial [Discosporangium mesarthrocarpum]
MASTSRQTLQDWNIWLSKPDKKGNDVNLTLENIYLNELQNRGNGIPLYDRLKSKFKHDLIEPEQFYLQYKLESEPYPINIELSKQEHAEAAFMKFARL